MIKTNKLNVGDSSENGQITIIDEDRLCYLVKSNSKGAVGLRTISKALLQEFVTFMEQHPEVPANEIRFKISGQSDIDKYEYGYGATLVTMAKMILGQEKILRSAKRAKRFQDSPLQRIFYGAPGTGKSYAIKKLTEGKNLIRTTFHPDSDYSTFVGAYKPTTKQVPVFSTYGEKAVAVKGADGQQITEDRIIYEFVDQAFLQAYTNAWKLYAQAVKEGKQPEEQYLIIEEINRGNCAQIFGDLFQLLDRDEEGFSEYPIKADKDMKKYLDSVFTNMVFLNAPALCGMNSEETAVKIRKGEILVLPSNLYIWATMNTSDQSLFPIDSAFKRRWDWEYVSIHNCNKGWRIAVNNDGYDWWDFLEKINGQIGSTTNSEDKKLGYFFCKADNNGIVSAEKFVSKVIFYLWNDVFKDFGFDNNIFKDEDGEVLSFNKFYTTDENGETKVVKSKVERFLKNLNLEVCPEEQTIPQDSFKPKSVIFKITEYPQDPQDLYERARGAWPMSVKHAEEIEYFYAYASPVKKIVACYKVTDKTRGTDGRYTFEGTPVDDDPMINKPVEKIASARGVVFYPENINK